MNALNPSQLWKKRLGDWVVNPYVGCEHGCLHCYCPAMPGVKFNNGGRSQAEWGDYLLPKAGVVEALRRQLKTFTPAKAKRTEWGDGWVLMSFLTDCYTPAEATQRLTRQCLELLLDAGHKVRVQTRSALVERDFDLLAAHKDRVRLGTSLPYLDDAVARILEPRATGPTRRLKMLEQAAARGIPVYVAIAPVMPWTEPSELLNIAIWAGELRATEVFCEVLNPKGENLAGMERALRAGGRVDLAERVKSYDAGAWARATAATLRLLAGGRAFVPWPDTGRAWAKHLPADEFRWLGQFLPPSTGLQAA